MLLCQGQCHVSTCVYICSVHPTPTMSELWVWFDTMFQCSNLVWFSIGFFITVEPQSWTPEVTNFSVLQIFGKLHHKHTRYDTKRIPLEVLTSVPTRTHLCFVSIQNYNKSCEVFRLADGTGSQGVGRGCIVLSSGLREVCKWLLARCKSPPTTTPAAAAGNGESSSASSLSSPDSPSQSGHEGAVLPRLYPPKWSQLQRSSHKLRSPNQCWCEQATRWMRQNVRKKDTWCRLDL